jgi:3-hydroxybutyrate dehydrogenase
VEKQIEARASGKGISAEEAARELLSEKQPSGRFTTVEEIAALALFLCSSAAANLTGACLPIDGSWTAQ